MKKIFFIFLTIVIFSIFVFFSFVKHESSNKENISFILEKPFLTVVRELANKNSLEKIVEENEGVVTSKYWEEFKIDVPDRIIRLREYQIDGLLKFKVLKNDDDLGKLLLAFEQKMHLDKNQLLINTNLEKPEGSVVGYSKTIQIEPIKESKTKIVLSNQIVVQKTIPFFFAETMNKKVKIANEKDLENLKQNIMALVGPNIILNRN